MMLIGNKVKFRDPKETEHPECIYTIFDLFKSELSGVSLLNARCGTRICGGPVNKFKLVKESELIK